MLPKITLLLALSGSSVPQAGPCDLMDRATVIALLGPTSTAGTPAGPERDDDQTLKHSTSSSSPPTLSAHDRPLSRRDVPRRPRVCCLLLPAASATSQERTHPPGGARSGD